MASAAERRARKQQGIRGDLVQRRAKPSTRPYVEPSSSYASESLPATSKSAVRKPLASKNAQASASSLNDLLNVN